MDVAAQPRKVQWALVFAGLVIAGVPGVIVGFIAAVAGTEVFGNHALAAFLGVAALMAAIYFTVYWLTRRRIPDLALGILIGGCMIALASGACGALLTGLNGPH